MGAIIRHVFRFIMLRIPHLVCIPVPPAIAPLPPRDRV
jgi:hypothetical protein